MIAREVEAAELGRHEGLAVELARRMQLLDDDGLQAARIGLLRALRKFDVGRGVAFSTYAAYWIRAELQRELADRQPVGTNATAMRRCRLALEARARMGPASIDEVAAVAGVSASAVEAAEGLGKLRIRDLWSRNGSGLLLEECLAASGRDLEALVHVREQHAILHATLERMDEERPRLAVVVRGRLAERTLADLGAELGVSRQRVRQLEEQGKAWLRREVERARPWSMQAKGAC